MSLDPALISVIEAIVDEKVNRCDLFTAFDVSVEVKRRGHQERHNNMKNVVHDLYAQVRMPNYTRTLVNIPNASQAWCYHHVNYDPATYSPQPHTSSTISPAPSNLSVSDFYKQGTVNPNDDNATANQVPSPTPTLVASHASARKPDARGTVCVPAELMRAVGFVPKETAYVAVILGSLVVCKSKATADGLSPVVCTYTVDHNANVRITSRILKQAFPSSQKTGFDFVRLSNGVQVKIAC